MRPICFYHGGCPDGMTAAWIVQRAIPDIELVPCVYGSGQPVPDCAGRDVVIVDYTFDNPTMIAIAQSAQSLMVLDHQRVHRDPPETVQETADERGSGRVVDHTSNRRPRAACVRQVVTHQPFGCTLRGDPSGDGRCAEHPLPAERARAGSHQNSSLGVAAIASASRRLEQAVSQ